MVNPLIGSIKTTVGLIWLGILLVCWKYIGIFGNGYIFFYFIQVYKLADVNLMIKLCFGSHSI